MTSTLPTPSRPARHLTLVDASATASQTAADLFRTAVRVLDQQR